MFSDPECVRLRNLDDLAASVRKAAGQQPIGERCAAVLAAMVKIAGKDEAGAPADAPQPQQAVTPGASGQRTEDPREGRAAMPIDERTMMVAEMARVAMTHFGLSTILYLTDQSHLGKD